MSSKGVAFLACAAAIVLGFVLFQINYEAAYCARHPGSSGGMRVPDGCLVEPSTLAVVLGNTGFGMLLLGIIGVVWTAVLKLRAELGR
ncbi:hypothetical protein PV733_28015 [Streptomyces europaeiscabiei]|uniref:hypothetical protein n=1 Tax=Streptomyces europaeiscabiei TaxID=146819 RepID=UPI0029BB43FF|nr:hypothetical protein [Streptomyces europaeiscabiei]MDX3712716.1 hypothetical protein [Streptomyces europaeiscabiei]